MTERTFVDPDRPGHEVTVCIAHSVVDCDRCVEAALLAAAAAANARIARCHEEVACPKCGAQVGQRCVRVGLSYRAPTRDAPLKHPHRERWTQVVPAR